MTTATLETPFAKDLVLVGGGHSHALMLRMMGMNPLEGVRVTLISDVAHAPYSGMLPGLVAGFYSYDDAHIDLRRLCQFAGVRFILAKACGLDLEQKRVLLEGRSPIGFDIVSLNIGSTPHKIDIPGAEEFAIPAKPVPQLLDRWEGIVASGKKTTAIVVGAGAGGVEMAVSMKKHLEPNLEVSLVHSGDEILETHNPKVRQIFSKLLEERGIPVHLGERVAHVGKHGVQCESGRKIAAEHVFWVTNASPPKWLAESGLATDERGFALVSPTLQALKHPFIFAAGDIATIQGMPRPKSGVFAVRMAKPLWANLRRHFTDKPLINFKPQKEFLSLIGTASGEAVASRKLLAWKSPLMWKWKDHIDRKFMRKFTDLPKMDDTANDAHGVARKPGDNAALPEILTQLRARSRMRCLGCAAKVGSSILTKALARIREEYGESIALSEFDTGDDAAVFTVPAGKQMVQTVDYLPALVADPYDFGRIATLHCFSDIFAMGAQAHSGLVTALLPFGSESVTEETLFQVLSGMIAILNDSGAKLYGGHTAEGDTLALGITCNGIITPGSELKKGGIKEGQAIILTKPIGTGTLFAAEMRLEAKGRWIDNALDSMLRSNRRPSGILREYGATACTDVTGFGLMGHLLEMLRPSKVGAAFDMTALPILEGALETSARGILSSLHLQNSIAANGILNAADFSGHEKYPLLFDPQTSGGLLASVPIENVQGCLSALTEAGVDATCIARVVPLEDSDAPIILE
ncbi:selenide, water dikinase SelD [Verrucomicrobiaceae bacterium 227]